MPTTTDLMVSAESAQRAAEERARAIRAEVQVILDRARGQGRAQLNEEEDARVAQLMAGLKKAKADAAGFGQEAANWRAERDKDAAIEAQVADVRPTGASLLGVASSGSRWVRTHDHKPAAVGRHEAFSAHPVVAETASARSGREAAVIGQHGSLGHLVRAMSTSSGSAIVPTVWLGDIIDRARNLSAVLRAGAEIVPMDAKTVQIGRLTGDPTASFRAEGSTITASDPTFDNVTLDSKTMSALVVGSMEWFQDATNVDEVVSNAIAQAMATQLDLQALFGGVTTGGETGATAFNTTYPTPPNPRGVLATLLAVASSSVLGGAANGTNQTAASFWNEIIDTIYTPADFNEAPNALLWPSKLARFYAKTYDTTNQPMRMPPVVEQISKFVTNQIPANFTQGTSTTNMSDVFVGDWSQLLIGQRLDFTIQTLTERYAENGQIGIVAHWRGDVGLARPRAFAVYRYLKSS